MNEKLHEKQKWGLKHIAGISIHNIYNTQCTHNARGK